jgi:hypothetical protein
MTGHKVTACVEKCFNTGLHGRPTLLLLLQAAILLRFLRLHRWHCSARFCFAGMHAKFTEWRASAFCVYKCCCDLLPLLFSATSIIIIMSSGVLHGKRNYSKRNANDLCLLLHLRCMLQVLALAAVRATQQLTQRCRDIIAANLAAADTFFARWTDIFEWHKPQGGPIAFPRLRTGDPIEQWSEQAVTECGVLLLPASIYDHEASVSRGHFRIGLGRQDMPQCLEQLDAWLVKKYRS